METARHKQNRPSRAIAIGAAAACIVPSLISEPAKADTPPVNITVTGPFCSDGKNTFNFDIDTSRATETTVVGTEVNETLVNSLAAVPGARFVGKFATELVAGQQFGLQNFINHIPVGEPINGTALDCEIKKITPLAPAFNERSGTNNDSVSIPAGQVGTVYSINGMPVEPGEHLARGSVTVTATPIENFLLEDGAVGSWYYEFSSKITDLSELPPFVPPINPADHPQKKLPKKYRKQCKKLIKINTLPITNPYSKKMRKLTKPEIKFLQNKCKVKYPKITGANQNTRMYKGEPYNWSEKPFDIIYNKNHRIAYVDGIRNFSFNDEGNLKGGYSSNSPYYLPNDSSKTYSIEEPIPGKNYNNDHIDTAIRIGVNNTTQEPKIVTVGLRTVGRNPALISGSRYIVDSGSNLKIDLQDTSKKLVDDKLLVNDPSAQYEVVKPKIEDEQWIGRVKKAMVYLAVSSTDGTIIEYSQRGVLLNKRPFGSRPGNDYL